MSTGITIHNVVSAKLLKYKYPSEVWGEGFENLQLEITDKAGNTTEINLFTEPNVFPDPEERTDAGD